MEVWIQPVSLGKTPSHKILQFIHINTEYCKSVPWKTHKTYKVFSAVSPSFFQLSINQSSTALETVRHFGTARSSSPATEPLYWQLTAKSRLFRCGEVCGKASISVDGWLCATFRTLSFWFDCFGSVSARLELQRGHPLVAAAALWTEAADVGQSLALQGVDWRILQVSKGKIGIRFR